MTYLDTIFLDGLDYKKRHFQQLNLAPIVREYLEHESNSHSDSLELPSKRRFCRKNIPIDTLENLTSAWEWAVKNFSGDLTRTFIESIASKIEPGITNYRADNVRVTGEDSITPPGHIKVYDQMEQLFSFVNSQELHPVENAAFAHLHLVRIHPFNDGNGRLSRLVQNLILRVNEYVPATIRNEEREFYQVLLRDGLRGYMYRTSTGITDIAVSTEEKSFYRYIASKVAIAFGDAINLANILPNKKVILKDAEIGQLFKFKKMIEGYFRSRKIPGYARIDKRTREMSVKGDISKDTIRGLIGKCNYFRKIKLVDSD